jgi:crotonobetainyl-CoA:carnitine CoA-transferase CaiB-like acyl-CoA transferase
MTTGLYVSNAIMFALHHRHRSGGDGQIIDASLFESLFSMLGPLPAEYRSLGRVRRRSGNRSSNSAPRGCYATSDGSWIAVSASTPAMAERFLRVYGLGALLEDRRFSTNESRVRNAKELDALVSEAMSSRTVAEHRALIERHDLTAVPVQTIADIERDPHWLARQLLVDVPGPAGVTRMHAVVPRLSDTPGRIKWAGGSIGEHNDAIYGGELGMDARQLAELGEIGAI